MMRPWTSSLLAGLALLVGAVGTAFGEVGEFLLIDRSLRATPVRLVEINADEIVVLSGPDSHEAIPLERCIALLRTKPQRVEVRAGVLLLNDGQRLPGQLSANTPLEPDALTWIHPWLAPLNVRLDHVRSLRTSIDQPPPEPRAADVVLLENGDRLEGFVTAIGEAIAIEVEIDGRPQTLRVPFDRVASLALVTPDREPSGTRIWFDDGTVLDVERLGVGDDGYPRFADALTGGDVDPESVRLSEIGAILFTANAMTPLAQLEPAQVAAPVPRFFVPEPRVLDQQAPLGVGPIEYRGPLLVRYRLPRGVARLAAHAVLRPTEREWGDFELLIYDDDEVVLRERLNAARPSVPINVKLHGSELTIEIALGARGPIQDRLVLERAMLLIE